MGSRRPSATAHPYSRSSAAHTTAATTAPALGPLLGCCPQPQSSESPAPHRRRPARAHAAVLIQHQPLRHLPPRHGHPARPRARRGVGPHTDPRRLLALATRRQEGLTRRVAAWQGVCERAGKRSSALSADLFDAAAAALGRRGGSDLRRHVAHPAPSSVSPPSCATLVTSVPARSALELIWAPTICACGPDVTLSLG